jgi:hypothetical protein
LVIHLYHWSISEVGPGNLSANKYPGRFWSTRMTEGVSYV